MPEAVDWKIDWKSVFPKNGRRQSTPKPKKPKVVEPEPDLGFWRDDPAVVRSRSTKNTNDRLFREFEQWRERFPGFIDDDKMVSFEKWKKLRSRGRL